MKDWLSLLLLVGLLFDAENALARCGGLMDAADNLEIKKFLRNAIKNDTGPEVRVKLADVNQARKYVYRFSPLEDLGFGLPGTQGWEMVSSTMNSSSLKGLAVGWKKKLPNGDYARVRLDYDEANGAHYNIELDIKSRAPSTQKYRLAVDFEGCDEKCVRRLAQGMTK